ncbi:MAG: tetratricopeptide repeat protein [Victivallaceae bacterium]|nr:tetratricopeptide repeat protein [Victivallaceae bacterium]
MLVSAVLSAFLTAIGANAQPAPPQMVPQAQENTTASAAVIDNRRLGAEAFAVGDYPGAARFFERAEGTLDSAPTREARRMRIAALIRAGEYGKAATLLSELEKLSPILELFSDRILRVDLMLAQGDDKGAAELLGTMTPREDSPVYVRWLTAQIAAETALEKYDKALALVEDLLRKRPETAAAARLARISIFQQSGKLAASAELLAASAPPETTAKQPDAQNSPKEKDPFASTDAEMDFSLRLLTLRQMLLERKLSEYKEALKQNAAVFARRDGRLYALHMEAAKLLDGEEKFDALKHAFRTAPDDLRRMAATKQLITDLIAGGKYPEAAAQAALYAENFPAARDRFEMLFLRGHLLTRAGHEKEALELYRSLISDRRLDNAGKYRAAGEAGNLESAMGQLHDAENSFARQKELASTPEEAQSALLALGDLANRGGTPPHFRRALTFYQQAAALKGAKSFAATLQMARTYYKLGDFRKTRELADTISPVKGDLGEKAAFLAAEATIGLLDYAEALKRYETFLTDYPTGELRRTALIRGAECARQLKLYSEAILFYEGAVKLAPKAPSAPAALYWAVNCALARQDAETMKKFVSLLLAEYPVSEYTSGAVLLLVDFLRSNEKFEAALDLLAALEKSNPSEALASRLLYERAQVLSGKGSSMEALKLLQKMIADHPKSPLLADGFFLAGNLHADLGEYAAAGASYRRAAETRKGGRFELLAQGRLADCYYSLYSLKLDRKLLRQAAEIYRNLSAEKDIRIGGQSLYKLGRCYELSDEPDKALELYNELLYRSLACRKENLPCPPAWAGKAAYAAAKLYLKRGSTDGALEALRVISLFQQLGIDTGEDFTTLADSIRKKYNLY